MVRKAGGAGGAGTASEILARARTILVIDWPTRDVPATLAAAGYKVIVKSGPGPADYTAWDICGDEVTTRALGRQPDFADLIYCYRPAEELPSIVGLARSLDAAAIWRQSGRAPDGERTPDGCWLPADESRWGYDLASTAGMGYVDDVYILDALATVILDTLAAPGEAG